MPIAMETASSLSADRPVSLDFGPAMTSPSGIENYLLFKDKRRDRKRKVQYQKFFRRLWMGGSQDKEQEDTVIKRNAGK